MSDATRILSAIEQGDRKAAEQLLPLVYDELRRLAAGKLAHESPGQTLQATALVHEAYIRLMNVEEAQHWDSRGHFFAAAAEAMRRILVDGGFLRMWDPVSANGGGTTLANGFNLEIFPGDVRVSAEINSAGTTDDWVFLWAGGSAPFFEHSYWVSLTFDRNEDDWGRLHVVKGGPVLGDYPSVVTWDRLLDLNRSYFVELAVTDDPVTGFPEVSGRVFDHEGGTQLLA